MIISYLMLQEFSRYDTRFREILVSVKLTLLEFNIIFKKYLWKHVRMYVKI